MKLKKKKIKQKTPTAFLSLSVWDEKLEVT